MPRTAGNRSCSMRMNEIVLCTCDDIWTDAGANVTAKAETDVLKLGAACAELDIAADQAVGMIGYGTVAVAATNINETWLDAKYNHLKFWFRSSVVLEAGDFTIGLDNAATFNTAVGAGHRNWNIPLIPAANTWYRCYVPCPRTLTDGTELASIDGVGITMVTDKTCTIWIDDIRLCNYQTAGDSTITLPSTQTIGNTNLDTSEALTELWYLPYRSGQVTIHELAQDCELSYYLGSNPATWTSSDVVSGTDRLVSGQTGTDLWRTATSIAFKQGASLVAGEYLSVLVVE